MPANKNSLTRIVLLDKLLADRYHSYSIQDMTDTLNRELPGYGQRNGVSKRCVEKDLEYLEKNFPVPVELERYTVEAHSMTSDRIYRKRCLRYADPTFSIFKDKLSEEEKGLLAAALSTIGSFDGLDTFGWLNDFSRRLGLVEQEPIIHISQNLLGDKTLMAEAFTAIRAKSVIRITYRKFNDSRKGKVILSPYLLKEYNRRWYIVGAAHDTGKVLNFALDRVVNIEIMPGYEYRPAPDDLTERYEDIIGITYNENSPLHEILFWVSDISAPYIRTKPLHGSQKELKRKRLEEVRNRHGLPPGGAFFSIECRENFELIRELTGFIDLKVLEPQPIVDAVKERVRRLYENYN